MRILALLPDDSVRALQRALGPQDAIGRLADAGALVRAAANPVDAIVIDPSILDETEWARARGVLESPDAPVLLYARLDTATVTRIVAASAVGVHEVLLRDVDDDPVAIRRRLETLRTPTPPTRVFARLAERLATLPVPLQGATVPLFCAGRVPRWADELARDARLPRRSIDRWMGRAGLSGTASVLDVARLARTWSPIVDQGLTPADVAARGGFRRARMLAVHARRIVGASPLHFGVKLTADEFVERLVQHATRDVPSTPAPRSRGRSAPEPARRSRRS